MLPLPKAPTKVMPQNPLFANAATTPTQIPFTPRTKVQLSPQQLAMGRQAIDMAGGVGSVGSVGAEEKIGQGTLKLAKELGPQELRQLNELHHAASGTLRNFLAATNKHDFLITHLKLDHIESQAGMRDAIKRIANHVGQEVWNKANQTEMSVSKTVKVPVKFLKDDAGKFAGSIKMHTAEELQQAVQTHISTAKHVVANMPKDAIDRLGGMPNLIRNAKNNIVQGLRSKGMSRAADAVSRLATDHPTLESFEQSIINALQ